MKLVTRVKLYVIYLFSSINSVLLEGKPGVYPYYRGVQETGSGITAMSKVTICSESLHREKGLNNYRESLGIKRLPTKGYCLERFCIDSFDVILSIPCRARSNYKKKFVIYIIH